jgi:hypothetical protein
VLDNTRAEQLVEALDLDGVFACSCCLFELAWRQHQGERVPWQTVAATARLVWPEMASSLERAIVAARMREIHDAEGALRELRERGADGRVARAVVRRLVEELAAEITARSP